MPAVPKALDIRPPHRDLPEDREPPHREGWHRCLSELATAVRA
jgi:hypothetical protein